MPTYKEGHLHILGSGPTPPTSVPVDPKKHWFVLHVLPEGLRLVHYPEECDYENILDNATEVSAEPWVIPGEEDLLGRGLVITVGETKYYLRAGPSPDAHSDDKWWRGYVQDRDEWLTRLGYEPAEEGIPVEPDLATEPEPEPETDSKEPLWKRENKKLGRLLVIASCPERGALDREITETTVFDQEVMTFLIVCRDQKVVQIAFDRAGTTTSSPQDYMMFDIATAWNKSKDGDWRKQKKYWAEVIKATRWFHAYKQMVKMGLLQIQTLHPDHALEVLCIHGGPITQAEQSTMPSILQGAREDCEKKGIKLVAEQRNVSYAELHDVLLEHSRECLHEIEKVDLDQGTGVGLHDIICPLGSLVRALATLTGLNLNGNQIVDVSPLATLTGLTTLALGGNQIVDVSPLATLTGLTVLALAGNQIVDVSPLATLTGLTTLYLRDNQIVDVSGLATLTGLTTLDLRDNQIVDVSPLATLTGLTELDLQGNKIVDVSPLATLTGLTTLDLQENKIVDVSPLATLTGLTELYLRDNQIVDVSPLATLTGLTTLVLTDNKIVQGKDVLEKLRQRGCEVYGVKGL